jgi:hypothetical protein
MQLLSLFILAATCLGLQAFAKQIVITVGGNTTEDAGAVFKPQTVVANQGDVVVFNCASPYLSCVAFSLTGP